MFPRRFVIACLAVFTCSVDAAVYRLELARQPVTVTGKTVEKITVNGSIPGPTLVWHDGETVVIQVANHLDEITSVHWHGLLLPGAMDGVPGLNGFDGIAPGTTFEYRFTVRQQGTYWYHAHSDAQEQDGLYGAIVILPRDAAPAPGLHEAVALFSDFAEDPARTVLARLKTMPEYYARTPFTFADWWRDVQQYGFVNAWKDLWQWRRMRMSKQDLADVSGYTFLWNGQTAEQNWTTLFAPGERVRLRVINASAMTIADVRIARPDGTSIPFTVVAADGRDVVPVSVTEFRFAPGETYDIEVTPPEALAYTLVAEPIDRSGFALATLAPQAGMRGPVPAHRPRAQLTMADMGMSMDMGSMDHDAMSEQDMNAMARDIQSGWAQTGTPRGDKALAYEQLRALHPQADTREPTRDITLHLGGNMLRYIWTLNGKVMRDAEPLQVQQGERVRLIFVNETMMAHPMHLHGMFVQLDNGQPAERMPDKHTVIIPPGQSVAVLLTASEAGSWAFHCHLLYHMASGMMTTLEVVSAAAPGATHAP